VVSDGSTDRTVELASRYFGQIDLIVFQENKGYGAAIKEAWRRSDAEILGFLDADGTCDPKFFANLCEGLVRESADVVLGCRLTRRSQMPLIRRLGNAVFAAILTTFSSNRVRDTASGMRVVRRMALPKIFPLPDGLHFTPAMSARSMLSDRVKIVEIEMPYRERTGQSKLRIAKDGLLFLKVILEAAFLYRPGRPLGILALLFFLTATVLMVQPSIYYLSHRLVLSWMIYRFLVSDLCGTAACLLFCASYLTDRMVAITLCGEVRNRETRWTARFFANGWSSALAGLFTAVGVALVLSSVIERVKTGGTNEHWSRYVAMTFLLSNALILAATRAIDYCLNMVAARLHYLTTSPPADLLQYEPQPNTAHDMAAKRSA
jgi:hypothetical protein